MRDKVKFNAKFYILLTVHLFKILGKLPTARTILLFVFISISKSGE